MTVQEISVRSELNPKTRALRERIHSRSIKIQERNYSRSRNWRGTCTPRTDP